MVCGFSAISYPSRLQLGLEAAALSRKDLNAAAREFSVKE
jgi:hypothetical protein